MRLNKLDVEMFKCYLIQLRELYMGFHNFPIVVLPLDRNWNGVTNRGAITTKFFDFDEITFGLVLLVVVAALEIEYI